jgi:hypothetical protein
VEPRLDLLGGTHAPEQAVLRPAAGVRRSSYPDGVQADDGTVYVVYEAAYPKTSPAISLMVSIYRRRHRRG